MQALEAQKERERAMLEAQKERERAAKERRTPVAPPPKTGLLGEKDAQEEKAGI